MCASAAYCINSIKWIYYYLCVDWFKREIYKYIFWVLWCFRQYIQHGDLYLVLNSLLPEIQSIHSKSLWYCYIFASLLFYMVWANDYALFGHCNCILLTLIYTGLRGLFDKLIAMAVVVYLLHDWKLKSIQFIQLMNIYTLNTRYAMYNI